MSTAAQSTGKLSSTPRIVPRKETCNPDRSITITEAQPWPSERMEAWLRRHVHPKSFEDDAHSAFGLGIRWLEIRPAIHFTEGEEWRAFEKARITESKWRRRFQSAADEAQRAAIAREVERVELDLDHIMSDGDYAFEIEGRPAFLPMRWRDQHLRRTVEVLRDEFGWQRADFNDPLTEWGSHCDPEYTEGAVRRAVRAVFGRETLSEHQKPDPPESAELNFPSWDGAVSDDPNDALYFNRDHAYVASTDTVLWFARDEHGKPELRHIKLQTFERIYMSKSVLTDSARKPVQLTELWMRNAQRRTYEKIVFKPGRDVPARFYNLWTGFHVPAMQDAAAANAHQAVHWWRDHLLKVVCKGDAALAEWLTCWFAHLIQKPGEKPRTALVLRGEEGVGKNSLVEPVGRLLGQHYMLTSKPRFMTGNFNSHLEASLLFVLDEAFSSGDRSAEGPLKDLITGETHNIERKGQEIYSVDNLTRVVILGNAAWLVKASPEARRFAVFDVSDEYRQDEVYFSGYHANFPKNPSTEREWEGYAALLAFLANYPISENVNVAPVTDALMAQKIASLEPAADWWYTSLRTGHIAGSTVSTDWPRDVNKDTLHAAFHAWAQSKNLRERLPDSSELMDELLALCPKLGKPFQKRIAGDPAYVRTRGWYKIPSLFTCRQEFDRRMKQSSSWPEESEAGTEVEPEVAAAAAAALFK